MPGVLARKLTIYATEDALLLQSPGSTRENESGSIRVEYGTSKITSVPKHAEDDDSAISFEAHGIVGLLNLVSSSHLIVITRREQVAQIRGKAIYTVRDVVLIPLSSQDEAEKAVKAAQKTLKPDARAETAADADTETEESDIGEEVDISTVEDDDLQIEAEQERELPSEAALLEPPPPGKGLVRKSTTFAKNVVQDRGKYGQFAERWFSKGGGWNANRRKRQGLSGDETNLALEQEEKQAAKGDELDITAGGTPQNETTSSSDPPPKEVAQKDDQDEKTSEHSGPQKSTTQSVLESLTPRILRSARLYFSTSGFFFAYDHDISGTLMQRSQLTSSLPLWKRFDGLYFWNHHLMKPFIDVDRGEVVLPLMQGFIGQRAFSIARTPGTENDVVAEATQDPKEVAAAQSTQSEPTEDANNNENFLLTLISRRSIKRAGLRYLRRGVDEEGNVANAVETEQILSSTSWDPADKAFSLLQSRGSLPLFFSQSPYSFKPLPVMFGSESTNHIAFEKHFSNLSKRYSEVQVASLVAKHGTEANIGESYESHAKHLNSSGGVNAGKKVGFEWFDFHAACKGMKFENVSILIESLDSSLKSFGWIVKQHDRNSRQQTGILRTNCMDCLDRTNVVQSAVAGWALTQQLAELGLHIDLKADPKTQWFNTLWADNGDAISKQYAGTAALKGDFTRTRKRNWTGALSDFSLSLNRYYNNIFGDYFLQTCIDYYLGNEGPSVFDEFETDMMSKDYALDMRRVRQNAIDSCVKIVLEDPDEVLLAAWTLSCPHASNTLRTLPFEECVVLLTDSAFYFCRFDWDTEKVGSFERVELVDLTELWRGAYITSALGPTHLDYEKNVGFAVRYKMTTKGVVRTNTRSLSVSEPVPREDEKEKEGEDEETEVDDKKTGKEEESKEDEIRLLAFKALPPKSFAANDDSNEIAAMSETQLVRHICNEVYKAALAAEKRQRAGRLGPDKTPQVEEKDVISVAEARKGTGYIESIGYSLKRLVWS